MRLLRPVYLVAPYSLEYLFGMYFDAINIRCCAISPTSCTRHIAVSLGSYFLLFPTFSDITFPPICATSCCGRSLLCVISVWNAKCFINFQFLRLVSTVSSFIRLVSTIPSFIWLVSTISSFIRLVSLLPCLLTWVCLFFVLFFGTLFTRSVPAIHAILLLPFSLYSCDLLCNFVPFWQSCMIYLGETLIGLTP